MSSLNPTTTTHDDCHVFLTVPDQTGCCGSLNYTNAGNYFLQRYFFFFSLLKETTSTLNLHSNRLAAGTARFVITMLCLRPDFACFGNSQFLSCTKPFLFFFFIFLFYIDRFHFFLSSSNSRFPRFERFPCNELQNDC